MLKILSYPSFQQVIAKLDYKTAGGKKNLLAVSAISLGVFLVYDSVFGGQHVYKQSCIFYARHFSEKKSVYEMNEQELFKFLEDSSCEGEALERLDIDIPEQEYRELIKLLAELLYKSPWEDIDPAGDISLASRRQMAASSIAVYGTYIPAAPFWMKFLPPYFPSFVHPKIKDVSRLALFVTAMRYLISELQEELCKLKGFKGFKSLNVLFQKLEGKKEYRSLRIVSALAVVIGTILYKSDIKFPTDLKTYLNHFPPTAPHNTKEEHDNHEIPTCFGRALMKQCLEGEERVIFIEDDKNIPENMFKSGIRLSKSEHAYGCQEEPLFFPLDLNEYKPRHFSERSYDQWKLAVQDLREKITAAQKPVLLLHFAQLCEDPYFQQELGALIKVYFHSKKELKIIIKGARKYEQASPKYAFLKETLDPSLGNFGIKTWQSDEELPLEKARKEKLKNLDNLLYFSEEDWQKKPEELFQATEGEELAVIFSDFVKIVQENLQSIDNEDLKKLLKDFEGLKNQLKKQDLETKKLAWEFLDSYRRQFGDNPLTLARLNKSRLRLKMMKILLLKKGLERKSLKKAFEIQRKIDRVYSRHFGNKSVVFPQN